MTEEEGRRLALGLAIVMELPSRDRGLGELRAFFDDEPEGAGARLDKWCWGNELGWVIDAPVDTVRFGDLNGLDTTALLENARARGPAMAYLFHRISLLLDGTPLLNPDGRGLASADRRDLPRQHREAAAHDPQQGRRGGVHHPIAARHHRQRHCQHPGRAVSPQFHLANPRGTREDYVDGLKLTDGPI